MNVRQKTLAALLVLGIGMSGCNTTNTPSTIKVEKSKKEASQVIVAYAVDNTKPAPTVQDYTDAKITGVSADNLATINAKLGTLAASISVDNVVDLVQKMVNDVINVVDRNGTDPENNDTNITATILEFIGSQHSKGESNITVAQLKKITPALENINDDYQDSYRSYIASADSNFSSPATRDEVQNMINVIDRDDGNGGENNNTNATATILESIGSQHNKGESNITVAQLKAIIPLLRDINDNYQDIYRNYIANTDNSFSSPATRDEVQSMIGDVNRLVSVSDATLADIATQHSNGSSDITVAQLKAIFPVLENINDDYQDSYRSYIASRDSNFSSPATRDEVQSMIDEVNRLVPVSDATLADIATQHSNGSSDITVAQLKAILPALRDINDDYQDSYRSYIASADTSFSSPATIGEVQSMIDAMNALNLPEHAILDRSFFKKTNGAFEHRFVYLPVENTATGRTWLNNNLGADYANVDSSNYNASQQATASNDHLAYGSLFQWGRKADGHELFDWTGATAGTAKHGDTDVTNDNPSDSLFIKQSDWRVNRDDTLWASESSANNVCPVGYRLPLAPNAVVDAENELAIELNSWDSKDADGSMSSDLKLPMAGGRKTNGDRVWTASYGIYWTGSIVPNYFVHDASDVYFGRALGLLDTSARGYGYSVRCIKDQTPAERSATILKMIGNDHNNNKSTVTVAQLKAILPALRDINNDYQDIYRSYIVSANNGFSSPATIGEVQSMIDAMNALNLPEHAILDRSFFEKTNGIFEHRFVYLPVSNPETGRTWLNNNLGADYANVDSSNYNASQQATASNDHLAYGSLFQWGRKADGHELINWTGNKNGTKKYGHTQTKSNNPSNSLFIGGDYDWRVTLDNTLWASESSANNVCPVGYRLPLDPNRADDGENEWYRETQTWSSKNQSGAINSVLKLPMSGRCHFGSNVIKEIGYEAAYWSGSANGDMGMTKNLDFYNHKLHSNANSAKTYGYNVRCIKD